jgi:hypothetical protein
VTPREAIARLLTEQDQEAAVGLLRTIDAAQDSDRRQALEALDGYLRARPEERPRAIVDALVALRRVS